MSARLALLALLCPLLGLAESFSGRVIGVTDGRTLTLLRDGRPVQVLLDGVRAPAPGQPYWDQSRQALAGLVMEQTIIVSVFSQDGTQTTALVLSPGGMNINQSMVRSGMAVCGFAHPGNLGLAHAETYARQNRLGLWSGGPASAPAGVILSPGARGSYREERRGGGYSVGGSGGSVVNAGHPGGMGPYGEVPATVIMVPHGVIGLSGASQSGSSTYTTTVIPPSGAVGSGRTTIYSTDYAPQPIPPYPQYAPTATYPKRTGR